MQEPEVDPYSAAALVIAAAVVGTVSAISSSQQQAKVARYNAALQQRDAEQQALMQERARTVDTTQAALERQSAAFEAGQIRLGASRQEARQRALVGASGVELSGSPLLAYLDNVRQHELDAQLATYQGEVRATRAEDQAALATFQAKQLRQSGQLSLQTGRIAASNLETQGYLQGGATLLSGVASGARTYYTLTPPTAAGGTGQQGVGAG